MNIEGRKIGLLVLLLIWMMPVVAQVNFGVRLGGGYSALIQKVGETYESGGRFGYSLAGLADIHLYERFSLRPEVAFVNQGGAYYSAPEVEGMSLHNKYWYYSLQVPVNLAYTFPIGDVGLSILAGPVADFSLFGKMRSRDQDVDIHFGHTEEEDLRPFDLGVNVGLAVEYKNFFFSVNSLFGTLDRRAVEREGESSVFQNNVTLSLGYFFRK